MSSKENVQLQNMKLHFIFGGHFFSSTLGLESKSGSTGPVESGSESRTLVKASVGDL